MRRRVLSVLVIISVLSFLFQDDYAQGKERGREVLDSQEAEKIAECFMVESNGGIEEDLKKDVIPMYDSQEDISAYMVTFNNDHKQQGYAVVNAKESRGQLSNTVTVKIILWRRQQISFVKVKRKRKNPKYIILAV